MELEAKQEAGRDDLDCPRLLLACEMDKIPG